MTKEAGGRVKILKIDEHQVGQRIDNFLIKQLKGVPRTRLYRSLRKGEVRVNGGRKKPTYKLSIGDQVRLPPLRVSPNSPQSTAAMCAAAAKVQILYQDESLLAIDKVAGLAVHAGSGLNWGVIEILRAANPDWPFLELVHRLDRATSGCLLLARQRSSLLRLQQMFGQEQSPRDRIHKQYLALLQGRLTPPVANKYLQIDAGLSTLKVSGERKRVVVNPQGRAACSRLHILETFQSTTLVRLELLSGRMHQARVHTQSIGHSIAGDDLYGDYKFNRELKKVGLKRLFLHAAELTFKHPLSGAEINLKSPLPLVLERVLESLR